MDQTLTDPRTELVRARALLEEWAEKATDERSKRADLQRRHDALGRELAQVRTQLSHLTAERDRANQALAGARARIDVLNLEIRRERRRLRRLSRAAVALLDTCPPARLTLAQRLRLRRRDPELDARTRREVSLIEQCPEFRPTWYVRHYPDAVSSGVHPALHYLRTGAARGYDPGPGFSTAAYLREHPWLEATNPLVHLARQRLRAS